MLPIYRKRDGRITEIRALIGDPGSVPATGTGWPQDRLWQWHWMPSRGYNCQGL